MKFILSLMCFSLLLSKDIDFIKDKLIDIPGINGDYDVGDFDQSYITWINQEDSVFSLYLMDLFNNNPTLIYTDTLPNIHPTIYCDYNSINIIWQSWVNNHWQLKMFDGSSITSISDSLSNNTDPSLSGNMLTWKNDEYVKVKSILSSNDTIFIVDSINCNNPEIMSLREENNWSVVYEKEIDGINKIFSAHYYKSPYDESETYNIEQISGINESRNPRFDISGYIAYESLINGFWKSIYTWKDDTTSNFNYNCTKPMSFTFQYISRNVEDCLYIYESDSIPGNKEIFYETEWYSAWGIGPRGNLSKMEGEDINPFIILLGDSVTVFWEHITDNGSEIWWAKDQFDPNTSIANSSQFSPDNFILEQSYPNPFNSTAKISYRLPFKDIWSFSIYDVKGREMKSIYNKEMNAGDYKITLDMANFSTGTYFYKISNGTISKSMKFSLIK